MRIGEAIRRAYGVNSPDDADLGPRAPEQVMTLARGLEPRIGDRAGDEGGVQRVLRSAADPPFPVSSRL